MWKYIDYVKTEVYFCADNGMLKSRPEDMPPSAGERPRKKLSFREPEIMGYYMQMKQGVASRLSRRSKKSKSEEPVSMPSTSSSMPNLKDETIAEKGNNGSDEDMELEVSILVFIWLGFNMMVFYPGIMIREANGRRFIGR